MLFNIPVYIYFIFCILGIILDVITTKIAFNKGFSEWNPLMNKFKNPILISSIISLVILIVMGIVSKYEPTSVAIFCFIFGLYRFTCGILNILKIKKHK